MIRFACMVGTNPPIPYLQEMAERELSVCIFPLAGASLLGGWLDYAGCLKPFPEDTPYVNVVCSVLGYPLGVPATAHDAGAGGLEAAQAVVTGAPAPAKSGGEVVYQPRTAFAQLYTHHENCLANFAIVLRWTDETALGAKMPEELQHYHSRFVFDAHALPIYVVSEIEEVLRAGRVG